MTEIDYRIDDALCEWATDVAKSIVGDRDIENIAKVGDRDIENIANNQIRKLWDVLRGDRDTRLAQKLALHQEKKAESDARNAKDPKRAAAAKTKRAFWEKVRAIVDDRCFREELEMRTDRQIADKQLLDMQILFAEMLYCELMYHKSTK